MPLKFVFIGATMLYFDYHHSVICTLCRASIDAWLRDCSCDSFTFHYLETLLILMYYLFEAMIMGRFRCSLACTHETVTKACDTEPTTGSTMCLPFIKICELQSRCKHWSLIRRLSQKEKKVVQTSWLNPLVINYLSSSHRTRVNQGHVEQNISVTPTIS